MKRYCKILAFLLSMLLLGGSLISCDRQWEPTETETTEALPVTVSLKGYTVIRAETADSKTVKAALALMNGINEKTGYNLSWDSDYLKAGETPAEEAKEILVGYTNRSESDALRYGDYEIFIANRRIVINGGSGEAVTEAVNYFLANCIDGKNATVTRTVHRESYPAENLQINGVKLSECSVKLVDDESRRLYEYLGERVGLRAGDGASCVISLATSDFAPMDTVTFQNDGKGNWVLKCNSVKGLSAAAVDWLLAQIGEKKEGNIMIEETGSITIPESAYEGVPQVESASDTPYFLATTEKDPLTYAVGDKICFCVSLMSGGKLCGYPLAKWQAETDDGKKYSGTAVGKAGKIVVSIPATGTGAVRLKVTACDANGQAISKVKQSDSWMEPDVFGACVNLEGFSQAKTEPSDFDSFWQTEIAKLNAVAPDALSFEKIDTPASVSTTAGSALKENFDFYRVKIATPSECGFAVGVLTVPKNAKANSVGITVKFNGYGVEDIEPAIADGQIVLNVCAHAIELGREASYYTNLSKSGATLYNYCFRNNETRESCYFRTMILRDLQAVRFIKAYAGTEGVKINGQKKSLGIWNGNLKVYGGSQGAFQSLAVAAFDHDVKEGFLWIPWMCDVAGTTEGKIGSTFRPAYTSALNYYDTINFAKRINKNAWLTIQIGLGDYVCPLSGTTALYNTLPCNVTAIFFQGMTHGYTPANCKSYQISKRAQ